MQHLVTTFLDTGDVEARFDGAVPRLKPAVSLSTVARGTAASVGAAGLVLATAIGRRLARRRTRFG
jgi:hypothetical protein